MFKWSLLITSNLITYPSRTKSRNCPTVSSWWTRLSMRIKSLTTILLLSPNTTFSGLATLPVLTCGSHPLVYLSTLSPFGTAHPRIAPQPMPEKVTEPRINKKKPKAVPLPHRHWLQLVPAVYPKLLSAWLWLHMLMLNASFHGRVLARHNSYFCIPSCAHIRLHKIVRFMQMLIISHFRRYKPFPASAPIMPITRCAWASR